MSIQEKSALSDQYTVGFLIAFIDFRDGKLIQIAPWPSWSLAATPSTPSSQISQFLSSLQPLVTRFNSAEAREKDDIDFVVENFGQQRADVEEWIKTVRWEERMAEVDEGVVRETLKVLQKAGVVREAEWELDLFVRSDVAKLV